MESSEHSINVELKLTPFALSFIDELIGIWGVNRAKVVESIIHKFLFNSKNLDLIQNIHKAESIIAKKKIDERELEEKLSNISSFGNHFDMDFFCQYLNITKRQFYDNLIKWAKKYNFKWIDTKIIFDNPE